MARLAVPSTAMPDSTLSRLSVRHRRTIDVAAACEALRDTEWIGTLVDPPPDRPGFRRYLADLALPLAPAATRPYPGRTTGKPAVRSNLY